MNRTTPYLLSPDDPRLTAYALGELDGEEFASVAAMVAAHPDLQSAVDDIRRAAEELTEALATEPLPEVTPLPVVASTNGRHAHGTVVPFPVLPAARVQTAERTAVPTIRRRPANPQPSYFTVISIAAACFMVVIYFADRRFTAQEQAEAVRTAQRDEAERTRIAAELASRKYVEMDLSRFAVNADLDRQLDVLRTYAQVDIDEEDYLPAEQQPRSSFPIDVATTSYGDVVRAIAAKQRPPVAVVRIEEMLNTFAYDYPGPDAADDAPFAAALEAADAPWAPGHRLVRIGLKGREDAIGRATPIARDVSIVVEFDPASVQAYRLIGYEKSPIVAQDALSSGRVNAAEVLSGHTVTALYEVIPVASVTTPATTAVADDAGTRLLTVRIDYARPDGAVARPLEFPLIDRGATFGDATGDFKFAAAVAGFGMILRQPHANGTITFGSIIAWAEQGVAHDRTGRRREFVGLVKDASEVVR